MKLSELMKDTEVKNNYSDVEISFVTDKPEKCEKGCAFVCINGMSFDGHNAIDEAKKNGAVAFITEKDTGRENCLITENTRKAYGLMCSRLFDEPSKKMKIIGVTGTNGKTSTASIIYSLLTLSGEKAALLGTAANIIDGKEEEASFTTPDAYEYNRLLKKAYDCGTKYCVCEVSSQALDQYRTFGTEFEIGVFTNISKEHLDYHKTFENYLEAKIKLFESCKKAVINLDDAHSEEIISSLKCSVTTFSTKNDHSDLTAKCIKYGDGTVEYAAVMFSEISRVKMTGIGEYSVKNSLAALAVMIKLGFSLEKTAGLVPLVKPVRGRGEKLNTDCGFSVIIDYAHTPDALYNILYALSRNKTGRIITLFGCGGERDKSKRPDMGNIASAFSDIVVLTNDNPRNEDEDEIIRDILAGINKCECEIFIEKDREQAMKLAFMKAKENDIVLLAGKGHESYQIIKNKKIPFDEREKAIKILGSISRGD